jgi:uncharacterized protein YjiS (DUF1127 family)
MSWNERSSAGGVTRWRPAACRPDLRRLDVVESPIGFSRSTPPVHVSHRRRAGMSVVPLRGQVGSLAWLATATSKAWAWLLREYCISRVTAALRALDNRSLRDIGIDRDQINDAVRHICDWR